MKLTKTLQNYELIWSHTSLLKFVFSLSYLAQSFNPSFLFSRRHNSSLLTLKRSFKGVTSSPFHPKLNPYLKVQTSLIIDLIFGLKFLFSLFVSMRKEAKMPPWSYFLSSRNFTLIKAGHGRVVKTKYTVKMQFVRTVPRIKMLYIGTVPTTKIQPIMTV